MVTKNTTKRIDPPLAYRVPDFCARVGIAKATFWKYQALGKIRTFKIGKRVLIPQDEVTQILKEGVA